MSTSNEKITVLNVNDDEGARYMTTLMLRRASFEVHEAGDGATALACCERVLPDVVVLDIHLPDMDGFEVCRRIKSNARSARCKVLITSAASVSLETKMQTFEVGAEGYLVQPFEAPEMVATIRSLARLNRTENALRARAAELEEVDRRKDEFLAMLGHELRNPLAAISASLPMLVRQDPLDDRDARAREVVRRQTQHLGRLVDDLLDVARVTHGKISLKEADLDLGALLNRISAVVRETKAAPRGQTLVVRLPEVPVTIKGDVLRLEQVFTNLLDNASKYTEKNGHLGLELSLDPPGSAERFARVRVSDDGAGIAPDKLGSVFDLFYQSGVSMDRSRGGLGIGLTLVRRLVELHGGKVSAESRGIGRGSAFEVALPLIERRRPMRDTVEPARIHTPPPSKRRVLIVEDNDDAAMALKDLLEIDGHEVVVASDGLTGVERATAMRPDVCLVDIGLPGVDGYEVARRLRAVEDQRSLFLVAMSGYGNEEHVAESNKAGFDLHLVKPVALEILERVVAQAKDFHARGASAALTTSSLMDGDIVAAR